MLRTRLYEQNQKKQKTSRRSAAQTQNDNPYNTLAAAEEKIALMAHLERLSAIERDVLIKRYGLINGREETLNQVGEELDLTRERVRQIQKKALKELRASDFDH